MSGAVAAYRVYDLPWTTAAEQEKKFRRVVVQCLTAVIVMSLVFTFLPVPEPDPFAVPEVPQRFARLLLEPQAPPSPPVVEPVPEPIAPPNPEESVSQQQVEPESPPEPEPEPVVDETVVARERAAIAGLLPFAEDLAELRANDTLDKLQQSGLAAAAESEAPSVERSLITSRVGSGSGGINTAELSRGTGGEGLAGRSTTQVDSPLDGFGLSGSAGAGAGDGHSASRSREEIEVVFDRNKGAIFALYNRALRQNPALEGKLVLRLTISPDGRVTFCEVVSSELGDPDLESKLVQRVLLFQFEPKDVEPITTTKPIDFFPA